MQRKLDIESTLLECIRILNREENFPQAVDMVLENLGMMHQADRAYIFEYSVLKNGGLIANNTYEWCSEGIFPQKEVLQNVPISYMSCWQKMFERREDVVTTILSQSGTAIWICTAYSSRKVSRASSSSLSS